MQHHSRNKAREVETVLRASQSVRELTPEEYGQLYRTKDLYVAAFLMARSFNLYGMEQVECRRVVDDGMGGERTTRTNVIYYFSFLYKREQGGEPDRNVIDRMAMNYFNMNKQSLNVNANTFVQSMKNIRSLITDPKF